MSQSEPGLVEGVLDLLVSRRFDDVRAAFVAQLRPFVLTSKLAEAWTTTFGEQSGPVTLGPRTSDARPDGVTEDRVVVHVGDRTGQLVVCATPTGALTALGLEPGTPTADVPWQPPCYADPATFDEVELQVGPRTVATPATLSLPRMPGRHPALVLLGGSGPTDRDGTSGSRKPLKDLAWGLASSAVAVLRFDKITYSRPDAMRHNAELTVADEYLVHADHALALLRATALVDDRRLVVAGHSLGGTVTPRVIARNSDVAGMIILAGAALPLHWSLVAQLRRMASADVPADEASLSALLEQVRRVDDPALTAATPASALPLGLPASYWLDLRGYHPAQLAAELPQPMLVLQGSEDAQATVEGDLAEWQAALGRRRNVQLRVFAGDDHFFMRTGDADGGGADSAGDAAEDASQEHVDEAVMQACVDWVRALP